MKTLSVHLIPVLSDNYIFVLRDEVSNLTICVDPAEGPPVVKFLEQKGWTLGYILITHHHPDHIGGIEFLKAKYQAKVFAGVHDQHRIQADHYLKDNEKIFLDTHEVKILFLPGHTMGHIAYYFETEMLLFCGDVLFSLGCGRLFEGTPDQMLHSLQRIKLMPDKMKIYCTHEYSQQNAHFALAVEPNNKALINRVAEINGLRASNISTIPTTLKSELECNPFLRAHSPEIRNNIEKKDATDLEVFTELRLRRNSF